MEFKGNTILITSGASGIGLALAQCFLQAGNQVIVCGRREDKLAEAKEKFPELHTRVCDVSNESDRQSLFDWVTGEFSELNVLVNNAGIQQRVNLLNDKHHWGHHRQEIIANFELRPPSIFPCFLSPIW